MLLLTFVHARKAMFSAEPVMCRVMSAGLGMNCPVSGLCRCRWTARLTSSQEKPCRQFQYSSPSSSLITLPYSLPNPAISVANLLISLGFIVLLLFLSLFLLLLL